MERELITIMRSNTWWKPLFAEGREIKQITIYNPKTLETITMNDRGYWTGADSVEDRAEYVTEAQIYKPKKILLYKDKSKTENLIFKHRKEGECILETIEKYDEIGWNLHIPCDGNICTLLNTEVVEENSPIIREGKKRIINIFTRTFKLCGKIVKLDERRVAKVEELEGFKEGVATLEETLRKCGIYLEESEIAELYNKFELVKRDKPLLWNEN